MSPRKDRKNKEYLIEAFMRASVLFAGVDLQKQFFSKNLAFVFKASSELAKDLRENTPIRWVVHAPEKDVLADLDDNERLHDSIHCNFNRDIIRIKDGSTASYRRLFQPEIHHENIDTVIVCGLYAVACVSSVIKYSIPKSARAIIVIDATNISLFDRLVDERGYDQTVTYLKEEARKLYGHHVIPMTSKEIMACQAEAEHRISVQKNTPS